MSVCAPGGTNLDSCVGSHGLTGVIMHTILGPHCVFLGVGVSVILYIQYTLCHVLLEQYLCVLCSYTI
jgi:hypothetical protein